MLAQQNYNINIGGLPISSGSAVPGSCPVDGALFFKNTATESWNVCISGTYSALGGGGAPSFPLLAPAATLNSYSFTGSTTTGMGSSGTNILDFSANAHNQLRINADGSMAFDSGTLGNVSFFIDNGFGTHAGQILPDATTGGISIFAIAGDATWGAGGSAGDVNFTTAAANKVISLRPSSGISYADKTAKADELGFFRGGNACRVTADITLPVNTTTTVCSFSLPGIAKAWAWQCQLPWVISAGTGTNTISIGVNASQTPTASTNGFAKIFTATTGTQTDSNAIAIAASGAINLLTSGTITPGATSFQAESSGTLLASATAGTFTITMTAAGTTATAAAKAGATCYLY